MSSPIRCPDCRGRNIILLGSTYITLPEFESKIYAQNMLCATCGASFITEEQTQRFIEAVKRKLAGV